MTKWLVIGYDELSARVARTFDSKEEAIESLNRCFKRVSHNEWVDRCGQKFMVVNDERSEE